MPSGLRRQRRCGWAAVSLRPAGQSPALPFSPALLFLCRRRRGGLSAPRSLPRS
ncbi:MAG: hypothetical protein EGR19_00475 [Dialister sp.]|nr:hypothetical protein [Dialister sp.]